MMVESITHRHSKTKWCNCNLLDALLPAAVAFKKGINHAWLNQSYLILFFSSFFFWTHLCQFADLGVGHGRDPVRVAVASRGQKGQVLALGNKENLKKNVAQDKFSYVKHREKMVLVQRSEIMQRNSIGASPLNNFLIFIQSIDSRSNSNLSNYFI